MRGRLLLLSVIGAAAAAACAVGQNDGSGSSASSADTAATCVADTAAAVPSKLSGTGCFSATDPTKPTDRLVPYDVVAPLWSDGAQKTRWLALPPGGKIHVNADGDWDLPVGSILAKEFTVSGKRVETRLFMHHTDGSWAGYSYEWNDAETEATLLADGKTKPLTTSDAASAASWTYPNPQQCMRCHNKSAGFSLGLETAQLNRSFDYPDGAANELDKLAALGLFESPPPPLAPGAPTLTAPADATKTADARARSYLHANCSFCHRPGGPGIGAADFRFSRTFKGTHTCDMDPSCGDQGVAGAKLITAGKPAASLVSLRMRSLGEGQRMPPLASVVVDEDGAALIDGWIGAMTACP